MNFVFLSPHFPPNYFRFCLHLNYLGVNVLGLADEPYENLNPELKSALTEYYKVNNLHNYDELLRALGFFTHKYGKIDWIDSQNEYWLETEALLRTDFNIQGIKLNTINQIKRKSLMKEVFNSHKIRTTRGKVIKNLPDGKRFVSEVGYPIVAKPDIGVGAAKTYKIGYLNELETFFAQKPDIDYIFEEFITGTICTFDGLTDQDGNIVFFSSMQYSQGVMEAVNNDDLMYYYTLREIPSDLEEIGRKTVKAFSVKARFFHFEYFRTPDNQLIALEVNIRPPGGLTTDMFNYANDIDIYGEWAHVMVHNRFTSEYTRPYFCCYIGRKFNRTYTYDHEHILQELGPKLIHNEPINGVFSQALGDYGYVVRSPEYGEIMEMVNFIHCQQEI